MQENSQQKSIVITGCNKGVGYGILKLLAQKGPEKYRFVMAVRKVDEAKKTLEELSKEIPGLENRTEIKELDITNSEDIQLFQKWIKDTYGSVDCLINNAGMSMKGDDFNIEKVEETFKTNVDGTMELTEKMLPYINSNGKVIIVGSHGGLVSMVKNEELQKQLMSPDLTKQDLSALIGRFKTAAREGKAGQEGWIEKAYAVSKIFINVYARVASNFEEVTKKGIQVYSCTPGFVKTDMTGNHEKGISIEEGAETPVYLVELPWELNKEYQGQFFREKKVFALDRPKDS